MVAKRRGLRHYVIALAILATAWEALAIGLNLPAFPRLGPALASLWDGMVGGPLLMHLWVSTRRVVAATALSLAVGLPLGLYLGRTSGPIGSVLLYLTHPIPKVVFLPVILVALGIGDASKIFLIALIVFFQILVTVRDAAAGVDRGHLVSISSLGGGEWHLYRHVLFPACMPKVFTALRLSMGTAVAVLFFAETYATTHGVGAFVWDAWSARAFDNMFAGVLAMAALGFVMHMAADAMEYWLCPWTRPA